MAVGLLVALAGDGELFLLNQEDMPQPLIRAACINFKLTYKCRPFVIQLPLAILGLGIVLWKLPNPPQKKLDQDDASPADAQLKKSSAISRVDFLGAAALVSMVLTGLLCLDQATKSSANHVSTVGFALGFVASSSVFYLVESRWAKEPILPLDLILKRDVLTSYSIICLQAAGQFGVSQILR